MTVGKVLGAGVKAFAKSAKLTKTVAEIAVKKPLMVFSHPESGVLKIYDAKATEILKGRATDFVKDPKVKLKMLQEDKKLTGEILKGLKDPKAQWGMESEGNFLKQMLNPKKSELLTPFQRFIGNAENPILKANIAGGKSAKGSLMLADGKTPMFEIEESPAKHFIETIKNLGLV